MHFIAAIWGIVFVTIFPLMMLISPFLAESLPKYLPVLWLVTAVVGFVIPCFLVQLKFYKTAAILCSAGAVSLMFVHAALPKNGIVWFYMPLLAETLIIIVIAVLEHRKVQKELDNMPAESILGEKPKPKYKRKRRKK